MHDERIVDASEPATSWIGGSPSSLIVRTLGTITRLDSCCMGSWQMKTNWSSCNGRVVTELNENPGSSGGGVSDSYRLLKPDGPCLEVNLHRLHTSMDTENRTKVT
jgi:hypothetical protein